VATFPAQNDLQKKVNGGGRLKFDGTYDGTYQVCQIKFVLKYIFIATMCVLLGSHFMQESVRNHGLFFFVLHDVALAHA